MNPRSTVTAVTASVLALVIAACGGGKEATATPPPRPTAQPAATQAPATATPSGPTPTRAPVPTPTPTPIPPTPTPVKELPKRGGTIRKATATDLLSLDATKVETFTIFFSLDEVWSNLTQYKSEFYTQTEFTGDLADRWEVNAGGDTYTFFLNPKARWQNVPPLNGRPVTSQDVKWAFELFQNPDYGSQMRGRVALVDKIETPDAKTVVLKLKSPANNVLFDLSWVSAKVHAKELLDQGLIGKPEGLVGSGPFAFDKREIGTRISLKRSANYWRDGVDGQPLPYVDAVETVVIPDPQTNVAALRAGQLDYAGITGLAAAQAATLKGVEGLVLTPGHPMFIRMVHMNQSVKPLADLRVRQALLKAADVRGIMVNANQAPDMPLESFVYSVAPQDLQYPLAKLQQRTTRDVAAAKKLMADAGYANGFKVEAMVVFNRAPEPEAALVLKQAWAEIGVDATVFTGPDSLTNARRAATNFEIMVGPMNLQGDPVAMLEGAWKSNGPINYAKYSNPKVDELIGRVKAEFDRPKLKALLEQAQDALWDDVAGIPFSPGLNYQAQWSRLKGFVNHYAWGDQGLKFAWLDRK